MLIMELLATKPHAAVECPPLYMEYHWYISVNGISVPAIKAESQDIEILKTIFFKTEDASSLSHSVMTS